MAGQHNYIQAIRAGEIGLINVPKKEKNHAICLAAVNVNGLDIYHVPKYMRSETIHYAAVYQNALALKFIDHEYLKEKPELVEMAVSRQGQMFHWLAKHLPDVITYNVCRKAVNASGSALSHVPSEHLTKELVKIAALNDGSALNIVFTSTNPEVKEAISEVISEIPLKHLPDHFKRYDICKAQVSKQGRQLKHVPFSLIDEAMIECALTSNPWAIEYVPITFNNLACVLNIIKNKLVPGELFAHIEAEPEFI